jgi:hypothetical protein
MTPQEAINRIKNHNEVHDRKEQNFAIYITEALNMAVEALEKQIPKQPLKWEFRTGQGYYNWGYMCPWCHNRDVDYLEHHCECGQALDWSDME